MMRHTLLGPLVLSALITTLGSAADPEAVRKDRNRIAGEWQIVALEINGNKALEQDAKKLTVVNQPDGTWILRSEGKEIFKGTSEVDPTTNPKTIDFIATEGEGISTEGEGKGKRHLGIYQLGKLTRKLCFVPAGLQRPTTFTSSSDNQQILITFQRQETK